MSTLQATLAATSSTGDYTVTPHHPITCADGMLEYHENGDFNCPHAKVGKDDPRMRAIMNCSIATLIIEMAVTKL